ncbi:hypothetical protein CMK11_17395 [Candidatus Poribacteria bacterium]|nr:hypothetical protein [Candidatus Poribacteria bacterium]
MPIVESILGSLAATALIRLARALGPKVTGWGSLEDVARDVDGVAALATTVREATAALDDGPLSDDPRLEVLLKQSGGLVADILEAYRLVPAAQADKIEETYAIFQTRLRRAFDDVEHDVADAAARAIFGRLRDFAADLCGASIRTGKLPAEDLHVPDRSAGPTLRIQHGDNASLVLTLIEKDGASETATVPFDFAMGEQDEKDMAWYLEEYLGHPYEPAPEQARVVEDWMREIGSDLFRAVFAGSAEAEDIWKTLRGRLHGARIEISEPETGGRVPWELMRHPDRDQPLSLRVGSFVRSAGTAAEAAGEPRILLDADGQVRILLVTCRPGGTADVPYRSVAVRLLRKVDATGNVRLDALRPPTYKALSDRLRAADADGEPYHIVHFDGHGTHTDLHDLFERWEAMERDEVNRRLADAAGTEDARRFDPGVEFSMLYPHKAQRGNRGYLVFENAGIDAIPRMVDGNELGALLHDTGVPILILNACRSDRSDGSARSDATEPKAEDAEGIVSQDQPYAFSSSAQQVLRLGVSGVVAMRHSVFVETAVEFVEDLYNHLLDGSTLGAAVSQGRKGLRDDPLREALDQKRPLQDWSVPVVYEQTPLALRPANAPAGEHESPSAGGFIDEAFPDEPDLDFVGRDATILALDRAFDEQKVVLLHGDAGKGKTTAVAEFARWYAKTRGVAGAVLFTSFEHHMPLERVLDKLGAVLGSSSADGVPWETVTGERERRDRALLLLRQTPVLWVWDNVEPVTGFPRGTESAWTSDEQGALRSFLREASAAGTKFILTSRRSERAWLRDLPRRVGIPRMPMRDRATLLRQVASKRGVPIQNIEPWLPLLKFSDGNPLALTVSAGLAISERRESEDDVAEFVGRLRAGEVDIGGDEAEGREHSLAASLRYGFEEAFSEEEQRRLSLLHLFQGVVNTQVLVSMGNPARDGYLAELAGISERDWVALLGRAEEIGLLTQTADWGDSVFYRLHPALPWYFRERFLIAYGDPDTANAKASRAVRSYVEAVGVFGDHLCASYVKGNRSALVGMRLEEENLLHVWRLARKHELWPCVTSAMQGLRPLYDLKGRRTEWRRLVEEITADLADGAADRPTSVHEDDEALITDYRVRILIDDRDWGNAERLQRLVVERSHEHARPLLERDVATLTHAERNVVRSYSISVFDLARVQLEQDSANCIGSYREVYRLDRWLGLLPDAAQTALSLGSAYLGAAAIRDLDEAERWYTISLDHAPKGDRHTRGQAYSALGSVELQRFNDARNVDASEATLLRHLNAAQQRCREGLDMLPAEAVADRARTHNQLGLVHRRRGRVDQALHDFRESIRYEEAQGSVYGAALTRENVAMLLAEHRRFSEALLYARAALDNFGSLGRGAADRVGRAQALIAHIKRLAAAHGTGGA